MSAQRFKPYPAYKESRVEWLGQIPDGWEVKRLRFSLHLNPLATGLCELPAGALTSFIPMEAVGEYGGLDLTRTKPLDEVQAGYSYFRDGDVIVAKITPCFENGKGALATGLVGGMAYGTTELHVLRPTPALDGGFLFFITMSDAFRRLGAGEMYGAGGQKRVPENFIDNLPHPVPPIPDQIAIAAFLDRETARIDALAEKKGRLIELLREERSALITRAVTKGLDPTVPMKDSAVDWLGEIPAHWKVRPLKSLSRLQTGLTLGKVYDDQSLTSLPYLRVANVQDGYLDLVEIAEVEVPRPEAARYELKAGDVLMTEGGDFDKLGRGHVWEAQIDPCLHQNHIFAVRPDSELLSGYLALTIGSAYGRAYFTSTSKQSTNLASTNSTKLGNFPVPAPDIDEQGAIVSFLDNDTARIDELIAKVREAIERLKEYRIALISAAVTGKIDVREAS